MTFKGLGLCLITISVAGCTTMLNQSADCGSYTLDEIDAVIVMYETYGTTPDTAWKMDDYYMARSFCYAHPLHPFGISNEGLEESCLFGVTCLPITLPADLIRMPIMHHRTGKIPEADIRQALLDIEKAREISGHKHVGYPSYYEYYGIIEDHGYTLSTERPDL